MAPPNALPPLPTASAPSVLGPAKLIYTMLRVRDLERSLHFYTAVLGMRLLKRQDYPSGRFTLAFIGYDVADDTAMLELTHNWGEHDYEKGTGFGHLALEVPDVAGACTRLAAAGVSIVRPPGPMQADAAEIIAFVLDPDGYRVELVESRA